MTGALFEITTFIDFYRHHGGKGGIAVAAPKGIPHKHRNLLSLISIEATGACIPIGRSEIFLQLFINIQVMPGVVEISLSS